MNRFISVITLAMLVMWVQPAMAYIDPGSGSAIMSAVIGFFVAIGLAVKTYWYKLKSFFRRQKNEDTDNEPDDSAQ
ncbi:MAG: hypothetical protein ABJ084_10590 [Halioglobus sp.]